MSEALRIVTFARFEDDDPVWTEVVFDLTVEDGRRVEMRSLVLRLMIWPLTCPRDSQV